MVGPVLATGGTEIHLSTLMPALAAIGHDIGYFALTSGGVLEPRARSGGVTLFGLPPGGGRTARAMRQVAAIRQTIRDFRPDVLHFFLPQGYILGSLAAELEGHHRRVMSRRSLTHYQRAYPGIGWLERRLHGRTGAVLGNSGVVLDELRAEGVGTDRLGLLHNGVALPEVLAPDDQTRLRAEMKAEPNDFLIAVVANLIPYKGHADLIDALQIASFDRPWRLALIGRDDGYGADLRSRAASAGLAERIAFLGERPDAATLLGAADLAVLPSHQEGFSNALLEGLVRGVPSIATAVGGNLDAIRDGSTGYLVPVANPSALAAVIGRVARDPDAAAKVGEAARRSAETRFTFAAMVAKYDALYRRIDDWGCIPVQDIIDGALTVAPQQSRKHEQ